MDTMSAEAIVIILEVSTESERLVETIEAWLRDSINCGVLRDNGHVGGNDVAGRHFHPTGSRHPHNHCRDLECA
jgi:hypothetical protein